MVTQLDLSKVFVGLAAPLIAYWLVFARRRFRTFPRAYNLFLLYCAAHILVTFVFVLPEELGFSYLDMVAQGDEGFFVLQESTGIYILRLVLFALFGYAVGFFLRPRKQLATIGLALGSGLLAAALLGSYRLVYDGSVTQFGGGYLNPNPLGATALVAIWLNLYGLLQPGRKLYLRILAVLLVVTSAVILLSSISRSAMLALLVGLLVLVRYVPSSKRISVVILLILLGLAVSMLLPAETSDSIEARLDISLIKERGGSGRLDIWQEYLIRWRDYFLIGVGKGRCTTVVSDSHILPKPKVTENTYLNMIVELGAPGLALFVWALLQMRRCLRGGVGGGCITLAEAIPRALFVSWLVLLFFSNKGGSRVFWLSMGILAAWGACLREGQTPERPESAAEHIAKASSAEESPQRREST